MMRQAEVLRGQTAGAEIEQNRREDRRRRRDVEQPLHVAAEFLLEGVDVRREAVEGRAVVVSSGHIRRVRGHPVPDLRFQFAPGKLPDRVRRQPALLKPALDALPALLVGGLLSVAAVRLGAWDLLFGVWMLLFGLAHMAYRQTLPGENYVVGLFYLAAGAVCLLAPGVRFTTPWPMGLVFFLGETAGGLVLLRQHQRRLEEEGEAS